MRGNLCNFALRFGMCGEVVLVERGFLWGVEWCRDVGCLSVCSLCVLYGLSMFSLCVLYVLSMCSLWLGYGWTMFCLEFD